MITFYRLQYAGALVAAAILVIWSFFLFRTQWTLEVLWEPAKSGQSQLFYNTGSGFSEWESVRREVQADKGLQWTEFSFRAGTLLDLRLDPSEGDGGFRIEKIQLRRRNEIRRWQLPLENWQPTHHIEEWRLVQEAGILRVDPGGNDPNLVYSQELPGKIDWQDSVTGWFLPGLLGILLACGLIRVRGFRWGGLLLVLTLVGTHLLLLDRYGSDLPDWDDWIAIGSQLLERKADGVFEAAHWIEGWNEHRILWTRLLIYSSILLNGQWDNLVLGVLATGLAGLLYWGVYRLVSPLFVDTGWWRIWVGWLVLLVVAPIAWQNFFWGFALQNYLVPLFAFATFAVMNRNRLGWRDGVAGALLGIAGLFTMGAGILAGLVLLIWAALLALCVQENRWRNWTIRSSVGAIVVLVGVGLLAGTTGQAHHQAGSLLQFLEIFLQLLSWPFSESIGVGILLWWVAPMACVCMWKRRQQESPQLHLVLAGALWTGGMAAATAFSRSKVALDHVHRYGDFLILGLIMQSCLWLYLWQNARGKPWLRRGIGIGFLLFMGTTGIRIAEKGFDVAVHYLPRLEEYYLEGESRTAAFIHDQEKKYVVEGYLPFFEYDHYQRWLTHPGIQPKLPPSVGAYLMLEPEQPDRFLYVSSWTEPLEDPGRRVRVYQHPHFRNEARSLSFHRPPFDPFWERRVNTASPVREYRWHANAGEPEQELTNWYFLETTGGVVQRIHWIDDQGEEGVFHRFPDPMGTRSQDRWVARIPQGKMADLKIQVQAPASQVPLQISQPRAAGGLRVLAEILFALSQYVLAPAFGMLPIWLLAPRFKDRVVR